MNYKILILIIFILFSGCSLKPPMPEVTTKIASNIQDVHVDDKWWKNFNDKKLNLLVNKALQNNTNLKLASLNIQRARQTLALQNADYLPTISFQADAGKSQTSGETASNTPQTTAMNHSISALLNYEVDLWGRVKNTAQAANARFQATKYDYVSAKISLIANVTSTYFSLIALNQQKDVLESTIKNYKQTWDYRKIQYDEGAINQVVYLRSKAEYEKAKVQLNDIKNNINLTTSALIMLTGDTLEDILYADISSKKTLPKEPEIPSGVSSNILLKRADVASALKKIEASNLLIGVARSAYYPTLSLTGSLGYQSDELDRLFVSNASIWSIAGSFVGNLFDFGRTDAKVELAKLDQNVSVIQYENTVKTALIEVRDALDKRKNAKTRKEYLKSLIVSLEKINSLSQDMFDEGYTTQLDLLDSQRLLLSNKVNYIEAKLAVIQSVVDIYKAFGGGFKSLKEDKEKQ